MNALTDSEWHLLLKEEIEESNGPVGEYRGGSVNPRETSQYSAGMKHAAAAENRKARRPPRWLSGIVRDCARSATHLTDEQSAAKISSARSKLSTAPMQAAPARRR